MLRTVRIPGSDGKQDNLLRTGSIARRHQLLDEVRIVFHHARFPPDLHALTVLVVDQEQEGLGVLGKIALRDELPVPREVDKADGVGIEDLQKPCRPAAMLDIGLRLTIRCGEKHAGLRLDELGKLQRDFRLEAACGLKPLVLPA